MISGRKVPSGNHGCERCLHLDECARVPAGKMYEQMIAMECHSTKNDGVSIRYTDPLPGPRSLDDFRAAFSRTKAAVSTMGASVYARASEGKYNVCVKVATAGAGSATVKGGSYKTVYDAYTVCVRAAEVISACHSIKPYCYPDAREAEKALRQTHIVGLMRAADEIALLLKFAPKGKL